MIHDLLNHLNIWAFHLEPVFYKLLFMSLSAVLIGSIIMLIRRLWDRKIPPAWKYVLWGLVLAALIIPNRPYSDLSLMTSYEPIQDISFREEYDEIRFVDHGLTGQEESLSEEEAQNIHHQRESLYLKSLVFDVVIPLLWAAGAAGCLLFFALGRLYLRRQIKRNKIISHCYDKLFLQCKEILKIQSPVKLTVQNYLSSPALMGVLKPSVLIPDYKGEISEESLKYILLHELSHYKRKDHWLNGLLLILQCVYWFNPLIWVIFRYVREDMEVMNDSYVLARIGQENHKHYAVSLIEVLGHAHSVTFTPRILCMADKQKNVERRIYMIKLGESFQKHKILVSAGCLAVIAAAFLLFMTTGSVSPQKAADMLMDSIHGENGSITFTIPNQYRPASDWNIMISGRQEFPDGMSMSNHFFEEENAGHRWEKGKTYSIPMENQHFTELSMDVFLPDGEERSADLLNFFFNEEYRNLWKYRTDYGRKNGSAMELAASLSYPDYMTYSRTSWEGSQKALTITLTVDENIRTDDTFPELKKPALTLFSLTGDLETVSFALNDEPSSEPLVISFNKDTPVEILGENYFEETADFESFIQVMQKIEDASESPALKKISYPIEGSDAREEFPSFALTGAFPENWTLQKDNPAGMVLPGEFSDVLYFYDGEQPMAAVGISTFDVSPEEEEQVPTDQYYKVVYPELRIASWMHWDPYTAVAGDPVSWETGITDLYYLDPTQMDAYAGRLPDCPSFDTYGILSYHKGLNVYAGIAFQPDTVEREFAEQLAASVKIIPAES